MATSLAVLLATLLLSGCGFHPRGTVELPPVLASACIEDGGLQGVAMAEIRRGLLHQGVQLPAPCPADGVVLAIRDLSSDRRVLSVGSSGRALEYALTEALSFELKRQTGEVLLPMQRVEVQRDLLFDETNVLGKANEEADLKRHMREELVLEMLRRIASLGTSPSP